MYINCIIQQILDTMFIEEIIYYYNSCPKTRLEDTSFDYLTMLNVTNVTFRKKANAVNREFMTVSIFMYYIVL